MLFVLSHQPGESRPAHPFGFPGQFGTVEDAGRPSKPVPDAIGSAGRSIMGGFASAGVSEAMTAPAGERLGPISTSPDSVRTRPVRAAGTA
jgi:hypothetical protein